ncbi:Festuclavine dehydrogenase [Pleurostoma richardsiae]|uniref:Festuclavine dehydrogenase n=1 Tax=Pleurostoma richardsiae TaxID=41990 RepID=A0AA38RJA6_9PEZI|nr:Festuclavine dehydrogenase [Pleurostoma richardsiae]
MTSPHPGNGTVLVLGGTGKTGSRITRLLEASSVPFLAASRSGAGDNGVKFDWMDRATWDLPFGAASPDAPITAVWLIGAPILEMAPLARDFIDLAREKGVRRFVFLSASSVECGGPVHGQVHQYLKELGDAGQIEWAVMRPTWFSENFAETPGHLYTIKAEGKVYSATGDGKVPFVSAEDIAACAVKALTDPEPLNSDLVILGPELLSYADVAAIISSVTGKKVVHENLTQEQLEQRFATFLPPDYSKMLALMDVAIANGSEDRTNDAVLTFTGQQPKPFRETAELSKAAWV